MAERTTKEILNEQLAGLRTDRYSWWMHWAEIARYLLPRRYRWLVTPNQMNRGSPMNGAILDSTGTIALRVLAAGMMSGMTSPTRPWFKLKIEGFSVADDNNPVNVWCEEVRTRMMRVFAESNFYNAIAVVYSDLGCFATAPMLIHEDYENVIRCTNPCAGEYYLGLGEDMMVKVFYREIVKTVLQLVKEFGIDNVSDQVRLAYESGSGLTQEIAVVHAIVPALPGVTGIPKKFPFHEFYWERGAGDLKDKFLRKRGYYSFPGIAPRWDVTGNDAYGNGCPGMDALGDVKQLQQETKRKAQVIDKMANPPMVADVELKNQPASTLPGGVTFVTKKDGVGFKPAYENFRPPIQEIMVDIQQVQERIKSIFFNDLFLMISQLNTVRTATEIDARREEKLIMLGPVLERFQNEALDLIVDRVFDIMLRGNLLPPPPAEIQGKPIKVEYVSMLAAAQRAVETGGIERLFQVVGGLAAIHPDALDVPNWDFAIEKYSNLLGNDPRLINPNATIAAQREAKQKAQQLQYMADVSQGAAKAGKTLSETDVGGGKNALESMMQ